MATTTRLTAHGSDCYRRNRSALVPSQPGLVETLDGIAIPDNVTPAIGRDGSPTFVTLTPHGTTCWLGHSSMPSISAPELFAGFCSDGRNVVLPGVLTGLEPLLLLPRMPAHTALFVAERDPLDLKLAMHLYNFSSSILGRRLVFLLGDEDTLADDLCRFFDGNPGYELPRHLLTVPHRSAAQTAGLQQALERAGRNIVAAQAKLVEDTAHTLARPAAISVSSSPRVAVVSVDACPSTGEDACRIQRALERLGWPSAICVPDAPHRCHTVSRLRAMEAIHADVVLTVNCAAGWLGRMVPGRIRVGSWLMPRAMMVAPKSDELPGCRAFFVPSVGIREALRRGGVPEAFLEYSAPAADDTIFFPCASAPQERGPTAVDVAVFGDLPDDRPEANGIELPSQVVLWRALQEVCGRQAARYSADRAEESLLTAERASGTTLRDPQIREHFLGLLRTRIAPAAVARATVDALCSCGFRVGVWGQNWCSGRPKEPGVWRGTIPGDVCVNELFHGAGVIVFPQCSPAAVQYALDAIVARTPVICRCPERPFLHEYPGFENMIPFLNLYTSVPHLLKIVRGLFEQPDRRLTVSEAARALVLEHHTVARRLVRIVDTLRGRAAGPTSVQT